MSKFKVGDIVKGINNNYLITDTKMTRATVVEIGVESEWWTPERWGDIIKIEILDHHTKSHIGGRYIVNAEDFELVENNIDWKVVIKPTSDTRTVGTLYRNGKPVTQVATKKHPDDEYDFGEAIRVICERLVGARQETPNEEAKKVYNGKVVCVANPFDCDLYTVGKIYTFKDGKVRFDNCDSDSPIGREPFTTFAEFTRWSTAEWIEVVEE